MNILMVSENFLNGGLETQINSTVQILKDKVNFFFAFKNYNDKWNYENVYSDFYFSPTCTINDFCHDVEALIKIIKENKIDVIHVHPFYSLFPAVFAAKICSKPVVYTYHGIMSYNFTSAINDTILLNMLSDYEIDKILSVSIGGTKVFENIIFEKDKIVFLPNSINLEKFSPCQISNNKSWALISRLDSDKISEIKKLINILDIIDIKELHIYGDGSDKESLEQYLLQNQLNNKVFLEGYCDNIQEELSGKFNGVIGIGRALMEAISLEYPTILIGYNKIAGLIDGNIYNDIKNKNFTNRALPNISVDVLKNQITQVYNDSYDKSFYKLFKQEFSTQIVSKLYLNELENINYSSLLNLDELFTEIKKIEGNDIFYTSTNVYELLRKYFVFNTRQPHQKNLFMFGDNLLTQKILNNILNDKIINENTKINNHIDNKISNIDNKINNEISNIDNKIINEISNIDNKIINEISNMDNKTNNEFSNISNQIDSFKEAVILKFTEQENSIKALSEHTMTYKNLKRKLKYKFKKNRGIK